MEEKRVSNTPNTQNQTQNITAYIITRVDEIYNRYTIKTQKKAKLEVVKKIVDELKQKLGKQIYTITIRWLEKIGEAEAIMVFSSDSEIVKKIEEVWRYIFPSYETENIKLVITTYNITSDMDKHEDDNIVKLLGTPIFIKRTGSTCYKNYVPVLSTVKNNIPIYIYILVEDCES